MARVVFVQPNAQLDFYGKYSMPLLGSFYLGEILRRRGHQVKVICGSVETVWDGQWMNPSLLEADFVGISAITCTADRAYQIADEIRNRNPRARLAIGGPHVTFQPEEALAHCDAVVRGEAEQLIVRLVEDTSVSGIVEGGPTDDLDSLPFPNFNMAPPLLRYMRYLPMATSRGCPFACTFCSVSLMFGRKVRFRSPANVLDELEQRVTEGYRRFFFTDDNFAANPDRAKEIVEGMIRRNMKIRWVAQARHDVARDEELLKIMKRANCYYVLIGFESINQESLASFNKKEDAEDIVRCIERLRRYDINIHAMFVLGADGDDSSTGIETSRFCRRLGLDSLQYAIMIPLPGTQLFSDLEAQGRILTKDWRLYDGTHTVFRPLKVAAFELQRMWEQAYRKFYTPRFFLSYLYCRHCLRKWHKLNANFVQWLKRIDPRPTGPINLSPV